MNLKFIHLKHPRSETFLNFDKIAYVERIEDVLFVYFDGRLQPVQLRKEAAEAFLEVVREKSRTIYSSPVENEKVEAEDPAVKLSK